MIDFGESRVTKKVKRRTWQQKLCSAECRDGENENGENCRVSYQRKLTLPWRARNARKSSGSLDRRSDTGTIFRRISKCARLMRRNHARCVYMDNDDSSFRS